MKQVFNLGGVNFTMSARFAGSVSGVWDNDRNMHNKFYVYVNTEFGKTSFCFFDSANNYYNCVTNLDRSALLGALECLFCDASCYNSAIDFNDFCSELGYNEISQYKTARKAFQGCKKASEKIDRVFGSFSSAVYSAITE